MFVLLGKILICIVVGAIVTVGIQLRPRAQRPLSLLEQSGIFVLGVMVGIVMLTTHSLYMAGH